MIESLDIKNIGGIKEASLTFDGAFIVITGESGAGKSSLVRALEFISGRRAQLGHIHTLSDSCEVEAVLASEPIDGLPDKLQPQEQTLIAHRSFTRSGRGKASLQQQTVPLTTLAAAMEKNIVIQSQFAQLNLLDPAKQLELVDSCGGETLKKTAEELESAFTSAIAAEKKIVNLKKRRAESERRFDKAPEIIRQIKLLELKPESEEEWERELRDFDTAEIKRRTLR
ncbi:MAG: AAA family ATPase, partial [Synergistes sp.]|nr:AAA family ATPase [Synergistes sp.]